MNEYFDRLKKAGYKSHDAARIVEFFREHFDAGLLNLIITAIEREKGIDNEL